MPSGFPSSYERQTSLSLLPTCCTKLPDNTLKEKHFTAPAMVTWSPVPLRQRQKGPQAAGSRGEATHLPRPACDAHYSTEWPNLTASGGGAAGPPTPPLAEGFGLPALAILESRPFRIPSCKAEPQTAAAPRAWQPRRLQTSGSPPCFLF